MTDERTLMEDAASFLRTRGGCHGAHRRDNCPGCQLITRLNAALASERLPKPMSTWAKVVENLAKDYDSAAADEVTAVLAEVAAEGQGWRLSQVAAIARWCVAAWSKGRLSAQAQAGEGFEDYWADHGADGSRCTLDEYNAAKAAWEARGAEVAVWEEWAMGAAPGDAVTSGATQRARISTALRNLGFVRARLAEVEASNAELADAAGGAAKEVARQVGLRQEVEAERDRQVSTLREDVATWRSRCNEQEERADTAETRAEQAERRLRASEWDEDIDGPRRLCNVCEHDLGPYGERHHQCGTAVLEAHAKGRAEATEAAAAWHDEQVAECAKEHARLMMELGPKAPSVISNSGKREAHSSSARRLRAGAHPKALGLDSLGGAPAESANEEQVAHARSMLGRAARGEYHGTESHLLDYCRIALAHPKGDAELQELSVHYHMPVTSPCARPSEPDPGEPTRGEAGALAPDVKLTYPPCSCTYGNRWVCVKHCGGHPIAKPETARLAEPPAPVEYACESRHPAKGRRCALSDGHDPPHRSNDGRSWWADIELPEAEVRRLDTKGEPKP